MAWRLSDEGIDETEADGLPPALSKVLCRAALCYAEVPREDDATGHKRHRPDCSEVSRASFSTFHVFFWLPHS